MKPLTQMTMVRNATENNTESRGRDSRGRYTSRGDSGGSQMSYENRMGYEGNTRNEYRNEYGAENRGGYRNEMMGGYRSEYEPVYNTFPEKNGNSPMEGDPTKGPSRGSRQYEEMERPENREYHITTDRYGNGTFRGESEGRRMIGYGGAEAQYRYPEYEDEMAHRSGQKERGYSSSEGVPELTKEKAKAWVKSMRSSDMSDKEKGERWSYDDTTQIMRQRGWQHEPAEWYAILHAMYYDFCKVAKKYGLSNNNEFYVDLAHAWLDDVDANEDKAALYYAKIAKH